MPLGKDWFKSLFGFEENATQFDNNIDLIQKNTGEFLLKLKKDPKKKIYNCGKFYTKTVAEIREQALQALQIYNTTDPTYWNFPHKLQVKNLANINILEYHGYIFNQDALFQVASQINCLEFINENMKPEDGITDYCNDLTQGPACALAAPAGTLYRNYFCMGDINTNTPQTEHNQINLLDELENQIGNDDVPAGSTDKKYFNIKNGYIFMNHQQQREFGDLLNHNDYKNTNFFTNLVDYIKIGIQENTEVLAYGDQKDLRFFNYENDVSKKFNVSQVYCGALDLYSRKNAYDPANPENINWFCKALLYAYYEATLWFGIINAVRRNNNAVYLTMLGCGAFGNDHAWVVEAISRALRLMKQYNVPLTVYIVHYGSINPIYMGLEGFFTDFAEEPVVSAQALKTKLYDTRVNLIKLTKKVDASTNVNQYTKKLYYVLDRCNENIKRLNSSI